MCFGETDIISLFHDYIHFVARCLLWKESVEYISARLLCQEENFKNVTMTIYANIWKEDMTGIFVLIVLRNVSAIYLFIIFLCLSAALPSVVTVRREMKLGWRIKCQTKMCYEKPESSFYVATNPSKSNPFKSTACPNRLQVKC